MNDFLLNIDAKFAVKEEDGKRYIEGYAVRFGVPTKNPRPDFRNGKFFYYQVDSNAFTEVMAKVEAREEDVALLYNHDDALVMASTNSGSLSFSVDEYGVFFKAEIADVSYADDVYKLIQRGDLSQMSFRATFKRDDLEEIEGSDGSPIRLIKNVERFMEVSVVLFPAFPETMAIAANEEESSEEDVETEEPEVKDEPIKYNSDIFRKRTKLLKIKSK